MATGLEKTAVSPHTLRSANALAPEPVNSLAQTAVNPLARAYQAYQQYVGQPFQQAVRGGVRGYFGLPLMTDASSVGREAYRQGEALGFTPGVGMPAGAVRMAAQGMQALPSIAGDISRVIGGLPSAAAARQAEDFVAYQRSIQPSDVSPLTAFHGTPHRFERFDASKIGTGEGAQVYGHGLYFAESPDVAKSYRTMDGGFDYVPTSPEAAEQIKRATNFADQAAIGLRDALDTHGGDVTKAAKSLRIYAQQSTNPEYKSAYEKLAQIAESGGIASKPSGSLYTVDIPDEMVDRMLDWNKPLSEQPKAVQNALNRLPQDIKDYVGIGKYEDLLGGTDILKPLGGLIGDAKASELLRQAGIPGIRYLDRSSRAGGEGTRNIVVFPGEEKNVKILSRD